MKAILRYFIIPLLCQSLVCGVAEAQKKDDQADNKREQRQKAQQNQRQQARKAQAARQGGQQQSARQNAERRAQQAKRNEAANRQKQQAERQAQQRSKAERQARQQQAETKRPAQTANRKQAEERQRAANKAAAKKKADAGTAKRKDTPAKRPAAKNERRADVARGKPAKRAQAKRMDLPGKRPNVKTAQRREEISPNRMQARRQAAARNTRVDQNQRRGVVRPGQNTRKIRRAEFRDPDRGWWASGGRRVDRDVRINRVTYVNNNFRRNVNWTTSRRSWGYNPWWYRTRVRPWYGSTWNYGWRPSYYRYHYHYHHGYYPPGYARVNVASAIGWGLLGWSLGTMVYDSGYRYYHNPYPVQTTVVYRDRPIDYSRPINTVAVETAPEDEEAVAEMTEQSEGHIERSQAAFREGNYLVALEHADKAIGVSPGDGALHEYRALIFFALGKYGDAAGVLNPVLASSPGWDWQTMIALYPSQEVYTNQLQRLETYSESNPDGADAHFLLGYHYMVCGHLDLATPQFERAVELVPADTVSKQLADLTRSSDEAPAEGETVPVEPAEEDEETPVPQPVPLEKLNGVWKSEAQGGGTITLSFRDDGTFTWTFSKDDRTNEFKGEYSSNDDGLLVLDSEDSQMVAEVLLPEDKQMNFMLVGGPPDDPGLDFTKS